MYIDIYVMSIHYEWFVIVLFNKCFEDPLHTVSELIMLSSFSHVAIYAIYELLDCSFNHPFSLRLQKLFGKLIILMPAIHLCTAVLMSGEQQVRLR